MEFDIVDVDTKTTGGSVQARHYRPRATGRVPTLVDVHGGAWIQGSRLTNAKIHEHLAARGIGVFALEFRMPPAARYPESVADVNRGIRWLKDNAASLGIHVPWVGGFGTSSGGHLLLLNLLRPRDLLYAGTTDDEADASLPYAVTCWPILDPWARFQMAQRRDKKNLITAHRAFWPDDESMRQGNPQGIVDRDEQQALPALLVVQGTGDENVEHERADIFATAYARHGGYVELVKFEGEPHAFIKDDALAGTALQALERVERFVHEQTINPIQ